jgi:prepilin-type N-terminal cleavage/methylation domain-containing protein
MKRSRRALIEDDDGFTLVETIVAFAILSIVMTIAVQIVGGGSVRARIGQQKSTALAHAQSQLAILSASDVLEPGIMEGKFDDGLPGARPYRLPRASRAQRPWLRTWSTSPCGRLMSWQER